MAYEQRELSGSLFKNDKKTEDKHPNAKGSATIAGVEYWVSGWTKEGPKGRWQSLSFKRKDEQKVSSTAGLAEMPDDLPF
jgi:hypothetical protein